MISRFRHRFTLPDGRASREAAPDRGLRKLAMRALLILGGAIITTGLNMGSVSIRPALAAAQPPIGYERWTNPDAKSGVDFGLTTEQVFEKYALPMVAPGLTPAYGTTDKRLIDIEIRGDDSPLANYVYDVVWVENEGDFELESWFVPGLTEDELQLLPQLAPQGIVAVDVERYPKGQEWRYSVILQRNAGHFYWEVLTDASWDEVQSSYDSQGLRLLDIDYADKGPLYTSDCQPAPQACNLASFDAILVANGGSNHIETRFWFNMTPELIADKQAQGYQIIDREDGGLSTATILVKPGLPFEVNDDLYDYDVTFYHNHHGRVIDLENSPTPSSMTPYSIVNFSSSAAPASPGLADPQQCDKDDGKHKAKHHRGGSKHQAKHHGSGKHRGKGKHRR